MASSGESNKVALILPTCNPARYWTAWIEAAQSQSPLVQVFVVDSSSSDGTDFSNLPADWDLLRIAKADFNHGRTRNLVLERVAVDTEVVVFMTQDALLCDTDSIQALVSVFRDPTVACAYGRQLPHHDATPLAVHARAFNYQSSSYTASLYDRPRLGLKVCFISNSFAAYRVSDLRAAGGFPSDVILGEDMSAAAKLLMAGRKIAYVAHASVRHSHNYSMSEEFCRYFDTGVFHARSPWLLITFGSPGGEGVRFVRSELNFLLKNAPLWIPSALGRTFAKWLGYRLGRLEALFPLWFKRRCSMHRGYWR